MNFFILINFLLLLIYTGSHSCNFSENILNHDQTNARKNHVFGHVYIVYQFEVLVFIGKILDLVIKPIG